MFLQGFKNMKIASALSSNRFIVINIFFLLIIPAQAHGQSGSDALRANTKTLELYGDFAMSTSKSKALEMNDTGSVSRIQAIVHAGDELNLGVSLNLETSTFAYELNSSTLSTAFQDIGIYYRFWYLQLGAIVASETVSSKKADADFLDFYGSGYGALFHILFPVDRGSLVYFKTHYILGSAVEDSFHDSVTMGTRMDIDIGGQVDITKKMMDLIFGYRYRTYSIAIDGTNYSELQTSTYLGVGFGWLF